ncbi:MAG TPA: CoA transferase [Dehalococcoidia bacterium]|nr:CoA transferase [Dehalococcoidia bacterium]
MTHILEGIKIVDLSQVAAVPMAARHLADFGADVIHVEPPHTGDSWRSFRPGSSIYETPGSDIPADGYIDHNWENYNRNKRSIILDLSQAEGKEIIHKLISEADVFMTNQRLYEREKFGLEYETLHEKYPRLIYGSLTGYGKKGPEKNNPAYDVTSYWTKAGTSHLFSMPELPPFIDGGGFGDNVAGISLAFGLMMALFGREKSGVGQEVDLSLFHTGIYQLTFFLAGTIATGRDYRDWAIRSREEKKNVLDMPYETKDGRWLLLAMPQPERWWPRFCHAIGREDLEHDPRFESFESRIENRDILFEILKDTFLTRTLVEWKPALSGIPFAPYQNLLEVIEDPQAKANDIFVELNHPTHGLMKVIDSPVKLSENPATMRRFAPEFGQHTEEVLLECGYTWEDISKFKEQGIVE